uniref:Essential protein Yae1 N-terminal domain-containing protein n=1 Tax=Aegilops tauschii subsp. strangulata TaxID=200361 RepID=A0A453GJX2_AEGTS
MDFLEPMIALDETHYQDGYKDGYDDGMVSGKEEGRQVGLKLGFQVGEELGFYQGCLDVWMSIIRLDQGAFSARVRKYMEQLAALLSNYPLSDPENNLQDMMKEIRLKFRVITGSLGAKLGSARKCAAPGIMEDTWSSVSNNHLKSLQLEKILESCYFLSL